MMLRRWILSAVLLLAGFAHADWAADRDGSAGYVTVTTLATAVDEAVPFVVVYLSDMPADFWTAMDAASDTDGKTIRVSTSDGTTQLACVPIGVNTSTDTGCLIFLGTGMSASVDVDYRIYVGNASLSMPTASGGMGEQAVFAAYAGVYFPGVDTRDWTSGGRTLTAVNTPGTAASGYEGITAATYNGTSQYHKYEGTQGVTDWPLTIETLDYAENTTHDGYSVNLGHSTSTNVRAGSQYHKYEGTQGVTDWPLTIETLDYAANTTHDGYSVNLGHSTSTNVRAGSQFAGTSTSDFFRGVFRGTTGATLSLPTLASAFSASTWYYHAVDIDANSGTRHAYQNATSASDTTTVVAPSFNRLGIGASVLGGVSTYLNGRVAVALLSSSVRSADYVSTMQDNWAGTMYSTGAWTANDSDVIAGSTGWVLFQTAGQSSTADVDWINTSNVLVDDATYAYCTVSDAPTTTEYLNLTNPAYGLTVPTGAPSYTVEFRIKGYRGNSSGGDRLYDETIQFIDDTGTRVGTNLAKTSEDWTTSATTRDYTLTGYTPDGTEFTSAAGLAIRVTGADAVGTLDPRVVTAWIRVSWTGTDPAHNTRGFFALTD